MGNNERSTNTSAQQFDLVNNINYRGAWLSSRFELAQMLNQEPLPSHDGRPGNRGSVVNIASQLGIVSRPNARKFCREGKGRKELRFDSGVLRLESCGHFDDEE